MGLPLFLFQLTTCAVGSYSTHTQEGNMFTELLEQLKAGSTADGAELRAGDLVGIPDEDVLHWGRIVALDGAWALVRVEDEEGVRELRVRRSSLCRL